MTRTTFKRHVCISGWLHSLVQHHKPPPPPPPPTTTTTTTIIPFGPVQSDQHNNSNQGHELLSRDVIYTETSDLAQQVTTKQIDHILGSRTFKTYLQFRKFSVLLKKAIRKCSPFYGTRRLITAFTKVCHWILAMIQMNSVQPHTSHFFHISFNFVIPSTLGQTRYSSVVGIVIRLRAGRSGVRIPIGATNFPPLLSFQTGSGAHPASHSIGTGVFPWCKATGALS